MKNPIFLMAATILALVFISNMPYAQASDVLLNVTSSAAAPGGEGRVTVILDANGSSEQVSALNFTVVYPQDIVTAYVLEGSASSYWEKSFQCTPQAGSYRCMIWGNSFPIDNMGEYPNVVAIVVLYPVATTTATSAQIQVTDATATSPGGTSLPVSTNAGYLTIAQPSNALRLVLSEVAGQPGGSANMDLYLDTRFAQEPAGLQWTFIYPPASVDAVQVSEGPAAMAAQKTITCAAQSQPGAYKCLLYGINLNNISNGIIATARFNLSSSAFGIIPIRFNETIAVSLEATQIPILAYAANITIADTTAPNIISVTASSITQNSTVVSWATDEPADSQVDYGLTSSYGFSSQLNSTLTTAHSQAITGLSSGTLYHYRVKSRDAAANQRNSSDYTFTTLPAQDTTRPTVTITSPANNSAVSGIVTISANASDNVAIAGVSFLVDGVSIGAEDMTAPYSTTWNSSTAANGWHNISAMARDTSNNNATSTIRVNVSNIIADTMPPTRSNGQPNGTLSFGTNQTNLSLTTNEIAICKYSATANSTYSSMTLFSNTNSTMHSIRITGMQNGWNYSYYVKCQDISGNTNPDDFTISFSVKYHKADTNQNGCIEMTELFDFITRWKVSNVDVNIRELIEAIGLWKKGC